MPRKAFVADLQDVVKSFNRSNVSDIRAGEDDGQVVFRYDGKGVSTEIIALVPDLGDYPDSHDYMFFTNADSIHPDIHQAIDSLPGCSGRKVADMLTKIVSSLDKATAGSACNPISLGEDGTMDIDSDSGSELEEEEDEDEDQGGYDSDDEAFSNRPARPTLSKTTDYSNQDRKSLRRRIRNDLQLAKQAKFRVCHIGDLDRGGVDGFVTLSIRVAKLGISEEALDAWNMEPAQYFMVLLKYSSGYQSLDNLIGNNQSGVNIRVGLSRRYKISVEDAVAAFAKLEDKSKSKQQFIDGGEVEASKGLSRLFIRGPLEELLNDRFIPLIKYRMAMGLPWLGAEEFYNDHQGRNLENDMPDARYWRDENVKSGITTSDHLTSNDKQKSFPLLAMQFALRHLTRCTEFCLVCHSKIEASFEALKPYVCSNPLCLYQYMSLGFGPSIEHEIIWQPYVVDLLISFCYNSAYSKRLKDLPTGMALMVPPATAIKEYQNLVSVGRYHGTYPNYSGDGRATNPPPAMNTSYDSFKAKYDKEQLELLFEANAPRVPLHVGDWITVYSDADIPSMHFQVREVLYPIVRLSKPLTSAHVLPEDEKIETTSKSFYGSSNRTSNAGIPKTAPTPPVLEFGSSKSAYEPVSFVIWNHNFDDLSDNEKFSTICLLLDALPPVSEMKGFLQSRGGQEVSLRQWGRPIPTASLGLLRWIIASNRSCIVQVDSLETGAKKPEERVCGMPGWMQFRFAQGAPDKEQRFMTSIQTTTATSKHPTLFAWHGSPLYNWHGIVREGLHFKNQDHGRAYGHGVYHAMDCSTSLGYTGGYGHYNYGQPKKEGNWSPGHWFNSQLRITSAIALNEIINSPSEFVSSSPYLVVAQLDWIQTRYLFVKCNLDGFDVLGSTPAQVYEQDPKWCARGADGKNVILPHNAVSKSRRPITEAPALRENKRIKLESVVDLSDETDIEDLTIFMSDEEPEVVSIKALEKSQAPSKKFATDPSKTDFTPGSLDTETLTLLDPPAYATSMATKALSRELQATLKIQDSNPLHELGWYIDRDNVNNVYQWIVELHSFEKDLPLAKDMKKQNVKSIVMEIRFGAQYPMSPPFVRIIRPRFLGFNQGGGGHVTLGGALCMELLTNTGWSAVSNIESVLLQVRLAMSSTDPRPARLDSHARSDYSVGEAVEAFIRACQTHGWEVPSDFRSNYAGSASMPARGF